MNKLMVSFIVVFLKGILNGVNIHFMTHVHSKS